MKTFAFLIALSMIVTQPIETQKESVSFTVKNNTAKSIPLVIPGVINRTCLRSVRAVLP